MHKDVINAASEVFIGLATKGIELDRDNSIKIQKHFERCFSMLTQYIMMPDGMKRDIHYEEMIDLWDTHLFEPEETQSEAEGNLDESINTLQLEIDVLVNFKDELEKTRKAKSEKIRAFKSKAKKDNLKQKTQEIKDRYNVSTRKR
jgi:hypothetical protein